MLKFLLLLAISFYFNSSNAQVKSGLANPLPEFLETHSKFKNFAEENAILIQGTFVFGRYNGQDSINIKPSPFRVTVAPVYLSKREVSVGEYMQFYAEWKGFYNGVNLTPSAVSMDGLPQDFLSKYISDKKNENYPMIGVSKAQAEVYCIWLGKKINRKYIKSNSGVLIRCRLPTNAEYQLAVLNSFKDVNFDAESVPGIEYSKNAKYFASKNNAFPFSTVNENEASELSFFNIVGNVAEWVADIPRNMKVGEQRRELNNTLEPSFTIPTNLKNLGLTNLGMVKGGAFNQSSFYLQPGVSVPLDKRKGYLNVGFRPVIQY